jgi:NADH-quinone oxidoreductase subunit D
MQDCGCSGTPLMYAFREREKILDLFESLSGSRMMCNFQRFGGCRVDPSAEWLAATRKLVDGYGAFLDEFEALLSGNEIVMARTQGVGRLPAALAVNAGVTGPMLRASGVGHDLRKVDGYGVYPRFNFRVPIGREGDVYDRYMVRMLEMRESISILDQALRGLPGGPILDPKSKQRGLRPKAGEAYGRIEGPKGEIGFFLVSDGTGNPTRYRVRAPSFVNLTILEDLCLGHSVADAVIILGSIDIVLGEVDR